MPKHFIIIGAGQAAAQAVHTLRQNSFGGRITLIGQERYVPYQRPPLSKKYLAGELETERLYLRPEKFYADRDVALEFGIRAERLEASARRVILEDGRALDYDGLMLATGSRVRRLDLPGSGLGGIHYVRTIADADSIRAELAPDKKLVMVGAGYIGLEIASVATSLGVDVTVLEAVDRVLARVVCPEVAQFYLDYHSKAGVRIHCSTGVAAFHGRTGVDAVETTAGRRFPCDLVIVGIGILPEVGLAEESGLTCDNGLNVDDHARTDDPNIVAAGDCTNHPNPFAGRRIRLESVHNAVEQAKTAALSLLGESQPYAQVPWFWSDQFDLKLQIAGLSEDHDQVIVRGNPDGDSFSACYLRAGKLVAVDAVNSPRDFIFGRKLIATGAVVSPEQLADSATSLGDLL
jgi:3-phenylpropionate/trans-cinnamate dioxygenase ferredoxin reductase subunit